MYSDATMISCLLLRCAIYLLAKLNNSVCLLIVVMYVHVHVTDTLHRLKLYNTVTCTVHVLYMYYN